MDDAKTYPIGVFSAKGRGKGTRPLLHVKEKLFFRGYDAALPLTAKACNL